MSKSNNKRHGPNRSGGVNISGSQVEIGGDVVGHDKKVTNQNSGIDAGELGRLLQIITSLKHKTQESDEMTEPQKEELIDLLDDAEQKAKDTDPKPDEIASKLNTFQKVLEAVKGIGTTG